MSDVIVKVEHLNKTFKLYNNPKDRLKEALSPFRKKYHHEYHALKDLSFEIKRGDSIGILGKNGAGKSTLLKILTGVLKQTSGTVNVNGRIAALLELGAGFNPDISGLDNIYFQGAILGFTNDEMKLKVSEIVDFADIGEYIYQPVKTYSSGMFARLAFSIAISVNPDILIVDEALSVGDIRFQIKCFRKLEELRDNGVTLIFVTHSTADIVRICKKALWLWSGSVKSFGEARRVTEEYHSYMVHDTIVQTINVVQDSIEETMIGDLTLEKIPPNALKTGESGACVTGVGLFDENDKKLKVLSGKQKVKIVYEFKTSTELQSPYFGFQIINKRGLKILGSNNHVIGNGFDPILPGKMCRVTFSFDFPEIENGVYVIGLGVNDGSIDTHIRYDNVWEAYEFTIESSSLYQRQSVILKVPNCKVKLEEIL